VGATVDDTPVQPSTWIAPISAPTSYTVDRFIT
jgi:hypothetical protein